MDFGMSLLLSIFASFSFNFVYFREGEATTYWISWAIRFACTFIIMWIISYPSVFFYDGFTIFWILAWFSIVNNIVDMCIAWGVADTPVVGIVYNVILIIVMIVVPIIDSNSTKSGRKAIYESINEQQISEEVFINDPVRLEHARVVPRATAVHKIRSRMTQDGVNFGTFYKMEIQDFHIIRVQGSLYWVAPLQFAKFTAQGNSGGITPGFAMVSAEDYNEEAVIITKRSNGEKLEMKYLTGAYFSQNLERHLRNQFKGNIFTDFTFEIDDELNPWWVTTVIKRQSGKAYWGVEGVVITNPETGESEMYEVEDVPEWVDRIFPESVALKWLKSWGRWQEGHLFDWAAEYKMEPTKTGTSLEAWMVYGSDGQPYWFTGFTSLNGSDGTLIGKAYLNTRTGKFVFLRSNEGGKNENEVLTIVDNKLAANKMVGNPVDPIPYNIFGEENSWLVPIIADNGELLYVSIVNGINGKCVVEDTKSQAFRSYQRILAQSDDYVASEVLDVQSRSGVIEYIQWIVRDGNSEVLFGIEGYPFTFVLSLDVLDSAGTPFERAVIGSEVNVEYEFTQGRLPMVTGYKLVGYEDIYSDTMQAILDAERGGSEVEEAAVE